MTIDEMIAELEQVRQEYGNIEAQLQNEPAEMDEMIVGHSVIFMVPEKYENGETVLNIRSWPY